jgi:hypothetical protein
VNLPAFGFSTTYNTAGTAKVRGSRARQQDLWVGLWVEKTIGTDAIGVAGLAKTLQSVK